MGNKEELSMLPVWKAVHYYIGLYCKVHERDRGIYANFIGNRERTETPKNDVE